ncbi:siderophore-interacting protein [Roseomonas sp. E05]|uniref:siderophore-interacting protein n=1 Tax=Roseomonas sp. E05 TaxID=3046310 RepID=UPI0024B93107|nr:siderophore-interacting protein [Roseomonas sp. E05]MDJ0387596.1 siderophore-interacting protein [Roseomonas sp. E05]
MSSATETDRTPQRVRHTVRLRPLEVLRAERLTPRMLRVTLGGAALEGFTSLGFDDHVKLFFPRPGDALPVAGAEGVSFPESAPRPPARDYTPRRYDAQAGTLAIDFALHEAGPATAWAEQAAPGQTLLVGGPRGSLVIPTAFDWHLLVGDETALPAIGRRLEELPAGSRAVVVAEVEGPEEEQTFQSAASVSVSWVHRRGAAPGRLDGLSAALAAAAFPPGAFYAWVAAESQVAKVLRRQLIAEKGAEPRWLKAAGYWKLGQSAVHEQHAED